MKSNLLSLLILLFPSPVYGQILPPPPPFPPLFLTPSPPSLPPDVYLLGAGDRIQIDIFNVPEYSGEKGQYQILDDGTVNFPLIGYVSLSGMTVEQATQIITQQYKKYLKRPHITVKVLATRPLQIAIAGEIHKPGSYTIPLNTGLINPGTPTGTQAPTLTRALQLAGGITPLADVRQIKIRRSSFGGKEQIINLNLWSLLETGDLRADLPLRDGDQIFIPTITELNPIESRQLADTNFAAKNGQPIHIVIVGEVLRPGTYTLNNDPKTQSFLTNNLPTISPNLSEDLSNSSLPNLGGTTITAAIKIAGGVTPRANIREISVRRLTRTGTEQTMKINLLDLLQKGDINQDITLQQGDTIIISKAEQNAPQNNVQNREITTSNLYPDTITISIVGEVLRPGSITLSPNSSLNQAIVASGGFNKARAEMDRVDLIRVNANGTVEKRQIQVNFSAGINEETNPILQQNDVIMVRRTGNAAFVDRMGNTLAPLSPVLGILRFLNIFW